MADIIPGEEIDTKHMIQGKKATHFFLPNPMNKEKSRKKDSDYADKLKEMNTLDLIDVDPDFGTIYFGKYFSSFSLLSPSALYFQHARLYF